MFKKIISLILCIGILSSMTLLLCSCKDDKNDEYPVTVGNVTIEDEPTNIVVLSDSLADLISYTGYDVKMVGRSIECDQEFLSVVPLVGTETDPNVESIVSYETDLVIAEDTLSDSAKQQLTDNGIKLLTLKQPTTLDELKATYVDLGTALGGKVTGKETGENSYNELVDTVKTFRSTISPKDIKSACYLYLDDTGALCTFTKDSVEQKMFSYCGAIDIFKSQETPQVDLELLKVGTPSCIFYDSEEVLTYLKNDPELCDMAALTNNETFLLKKSDFERMGVTFEENIYQMIQFMFGKDATPDEATPQEAQPTSSTEPSTQTTAETVVGFVE